METGGAGLRGDKVSVRGAQRIESREGVVNSDDGVCVKKRTGTVRDEKREEVRQNSEESMQEGPGCNG